MRRHGPAPCRPPGEPGQKQSDCDAEPRGPRGDATLAACRLPLGPLLRVQRFGCHFRILLVLHPRRRGPVRGRAFHPRQKGGAHRECQVCDVADRDAPVHRQIVIRIGSAIRVQRFLGNVQKQRPTPDLLNELAALRERMRAIEEAREADVEPVEKKAGDWLQW